MRPIISFDNAQYENLLPVYMVKSWNELLSTTTIKLKSLITRVTEQQNRQDAQDKQTRQPDHMRVAIEDSARN